MPARARAPPRGGRASRSGSARAGESSSSASDSGSLASGSAAEICAARLRIASTGRSARPATRYPASEASSSATGPPIRRRVEQVRERLVAVVGRRAHHHDQRPLAGVGRPREQALPPSSPGIDERSKKVSPPARFGARPRSARRPPVSCGVASTIAPLGVSTCAKLSSGRSGPPDPRGRYRTRATSAARSSARFQALVDRLVELVLLAQVDEQSQRREDQCHHNGEGERHPVRIGIPAHRPPSPPERPPSSRSR